MWTLYCTVPCKEHLMNNREISNKVFAEKFSCGSKNDAKG